MFSFFQTIFHKVIAIGAGLIIATGIVSVPELPPEPVQKKAVEVKQVETPKQEDKQTTAQVTSGNISAASENVPNKSAQVVIPTPVPNSALTPNPVPTNPPVPRPAPSSSSIVISQFANDYKLSTSISGNKITFIANGYRDKQSVRGRFKWWSVTKANLDNVINAGAPGSFRFPDNDHDGIEPAQFTNEIPLSSLVPEGSQGYARYFFKFFLDRGNVSSETEPIEFEVNTPIRYGYTETDQQIQVNTTPPPAPVPAATQKQMILKLEASCQNEQLNGRSCRGSVSYSELGGQSLRGIPITLSDDANGVFYCGPDDICAGGTILDNSGDRAATSMTSKTSINSDCKNGTSCLFFNYSPMTAGTRILTATATGASNHISVPGQIDRCAGHNIWELNIECNVVDSISVINFIDPKYPDLGKVKLSSGSLGNIGFLKFSQGDGLSIIKEITYDSDVSIVGILRMSGVYTRCNSGSCFPDGLSVSSSIIYPTIYSLSTQSSPILPIGIHTFTIKTIRIGGPNGQDRFVTGLPLTFTYEIIQ